MRRWEIDFSGSSVEANDGDYVLYTDAQASISQLEAALQTIRQAVMAANSFGDYQAGLVTVDSLARQALSPK